MYTVYYKSWQHVHSVHRPMPQTRFIWHKDIQPRYRNRGLNSSVGSVLGPLSCVVQGHRFNPPLGFQWRGFFPWAWHQFWVHSPQNSFWWEHKLRSSLCTHPFHYTDSKDPDVHVLDGWMPATKRHPAAPSTKTECDYLYQVSLD